ncbi:MAG TPA: PEGA domain-containing protein [Methanospirillum sp.]|nr:PEGA domain-containing protein [Methanospirillum sp.]
MNQSRGSGQSGASNDKNDSSEIVGTSRTAVTRLTGDQKNPSSSSGNEQPTPSFTPVSSYPNGTNPIPGYNSPHPGPSPVKSVVPTASSTPVSAAPTVNHPGSGYSSPSSIPSPVKSVVPTASSTPKSSRPNETHFGPGYNSPSQVPSPVKSVIPTASSTPVSSNPNETHFGPGSGSLNPAPTPQVSNNPTPISTPVSVFPNGTHPGPGPVYPSTVPTPVMSGIPTPIMTPVSDHPNGTYPGPGYNYPGQSPVFTEIPTPVITQGPNYPDGRYSPGPQPPFTYPATPVVTPSPDQPYYTPTHVPGDNDPDPIMSDILLHRGDPNYYNDRYSYPDPGHYRYDSSPFYAPRYDRDSGAIQVISTPSGAVVYLNNNYEGKTPSSGYLGISSLTPGDYQITISSVGYYDYTSIVSVYRNEVITVNAVLDPVTSGSAPSVTDGGTIDVQSSPSEAGVLLNNVYRGTTPINLQSITPGAYNLTVFKDGYAWYARDISVTSGQTTAVSAVLSPQSSAQNDQSHVQAAETVVPVSTKSPLPIWIFFVALAMGSILAARRQ